MVHGINYFILSILFLKSFESSPTRSIENTAPICNLGSGPYGLKISGRRGCISCPSGRKTLNCKLSFGLNFIVCFIEEFSVKKVPKFGRATCPTGAIKSAFLLSGLLLYIIPDDALFGDDRLDIST